MGSVLHVPPAVGLSVRRLDGTVVITLSGELDIATVPGLREAFQRSLRSPAGRIIIDLAELAFCDAAGLAALVGVRRRAQLLGGTLALAAPRAQVGRLLQITGLHRAFSIFGTVPAAVEAGRGRPVLPGVA